MFLPWYNRYNTESAAGRSSRLGTKTESVSDHRAELQNISNASFDHRDEAVCPSSGVSIASPLPGVACQATPKALRRFVRNCTSFRRRGQHRLKTYRL